MMPPHVTSIETASQKLLVHGWSLTDADWEEELTLLDLEEGGYVDFKVDVDDEWVGEGTNPGSMQVKCIAEVKPAELCAGRKYRIEVLGESVEFDGWDA
ncbi:MAG: hypothetical protein GY898_19955 [Proteobacteria bacterium]|nr:hypothetical protein [Pseudomonadota bacterium]